MPEFMFGMGAGIILTVVILIAILGAYARSDNTHDQRDGIRHADREWDLESRIATARLRDIRRNDIPTVRRINDNQSA